MAMRKYGTSQDPYLEVEEDDSALTKEAATKEWTSEDEDDLMGETES